MVFKKNLLFLYSLDIKYSSPLYPQDNEYRQMGLDCVKTAYNLLEAKDWKLEKETPKGDKIYSTKREAMGKGKVYKLTVRVIYHCASSKV